MTDIGRLTEIARTIETITISLRAGKTTKIETKIAGATDQPTGGQHFLGQ
jgi:hypothetical protein